MVSLCKSHFSLFELSSDSSLKHFLQILQNLEFTYAKFLLWSHAETLNQA